MPDRTFAVLYPVAGLVAGDQVEEAQLEGCQVDALVEGGFLHDLNLAAPSPPTALETPPPFDPPTGG